MSGDVIEYELSLETALRRFPHDQLTAERYDTLPADARRDIEVVDGMIGFRPRPTRRHQDVATELREVLRSTCDPTWSAVMGIDLRIADEPLHNRQPDVVVCRADLTDIEMLRPEDVFLVVEVVSPGSQFTDRKIKSIVYADAGIRHYWRVETSDAVPIVFAYILDEATRTYNEVGAYVGKVEAVVPFPVTVDLSDI